MNTKDAFAAVIALLCSALAACAPSGTDCDDPSVLDIVKSQFIRPELALAYYAKEGHQYHENWSVADDIIGPLSDMENRTESQDKMLLDARLAVQRAAQQANIEIVGMRRVAIDSEIALSCECIADVQIDGARVLPNIQYTGQHSLDSLAYAVASNISVAKLVEHLEDREEKMKREELNIDLGLGNVPD